MAKPPEAKSSRNSRAMRSDPLRERFGHSIMDGRLLRGERSRGLVMTRAVDIASLQGLNSLSFGRLATETAMSKAGIQALFPTKEILQKETVTEAISRFRDFVIRPAEAEPRGVHRFRMLIDRWLDYAERPLFAGGCFFAANLPELDSHPGPLRDLVAGAQRAWVAQLSTELKYAMEQEEIRHSDPDLAAFQIEAVLRSANTALRLGDLTVTHKVRRVVDGLLEGASQ